MNFKNIIQEENASLVASNDRHRVENAEIGRVVDWLEEQVDKKERKNTEEQTVTRNNIIFQCRTNLFCRVEC